MRSACSTLAYRNLPVEQALEAIAKSGFNRAEIVAVPDFCPHIDLVARPAGQAEQLAKLARDSGLEIVDVNSVPGNPDAWDDPDELLRRHTDSQPAALLLPRPGRQPDRIHKDRRGPSQ
jgi:sugar phosphate isomerase/epimerase